MTCPNRIAMPAGQNKPGSQDNHAIMCEARQKFAVAWADWVRKAPYSQITEELQGGIRQITDLTRLLAGLDPRGKL